MRSITDITDELVELVKAAPSVKDRGFSLFNLEELMTNIIVFPSVGVIYEGATVKQNSVQGQPRKSSAIFYTMYFTVVIGMNYKAGTNTDTKPVATDLLDEVRQIVLGYRRPGKSERPWRYSGETPMNTDVMEGVIYYGQTWEKDILAEGNSAN